MMNPLASLRTLFAFLTLSIESKFPSTRRAVSTAFAIGIIVIIIAAGGVIIYLLVVAPGTTTSVYTP